MPNLIEADWMQLAGCVVDDPADTRFIRRPSPVEDDEWGLVCSRCPVFAECLAWADRVEVSGVYVCGEWRE